MLQLDDYLVTKRGEWADETYQKYKCILTGLVLVCPDLAHATLSEFSSWLYRDSWGDSSRYVALKAVQGWLRWAGIEHAILALRVKRHEGPPQRSLNRAQLIRLLESFNTMSRKGIRDLAMCALMVDSGLRASEVCRLEVGRMDLSECRLTVRIKGKRWAEGVYSESTARYLSNWLSARVARPGVDSVFVAVYLGTQMTRQGLHTTIKRWGIVAGIGILSPHDLRRTFAVLSTRAGAPGRVLQAAGRWSSLAMVERYTQAIDAEDMRPYFPVTRVGL